MDSKALEAECAVLEARVDALGKELAESRKQNKAIAKQLARIGQTKPTPPTKPARLPKGGYIRAIIGDTHGCHLDKAAWAACMADLKSLDIAQVVLLGDHIECSGFLAEHQSPFTISQAKYSYAQDLDAANQWLNELQECCPSAEYHMIQGNHCERVEKWIMGHTLANDDDRKLLLEVLDPEYRLNLATRKIKFYRRDQFNDTCSERGTLKLGNCLFVHEVSTAKNAARIAVDRYATNVVFGHSHRPDISYSRKPGVGQIMAANPGCLCTLVPVWQLSRSSINDWGHGYSLQIVAPDESFLHINVQIVDGKSSLMPLTLSRKRKKK
ncbi:uncharacterized protein METZ01_LOCUS84466 [marine metagenome]|jgi:predicted phosphodiesterase|uniref:Calcineurin-like phosphoesterase domain-containing protein n=1 Tax=marine metagenome TaxID=408172 RepID=A0A381UTV8_9ZZZZ